MRVDGLEKVTGRAKYGFDVYQHGMLHGKMKRSDRPHARILRVDTSAAEQLPGVRGVLTGKDGPPGLHGNVLYDTPVLAKEVVRYVGEPVAAVAADTVEIAEEAADLIKVDYEDLPAVYDAEEAMKPNPPAVIHPDKEKYRRSPIWTPKFDPTRPNVGNSVKVSKGDVEKAFASADVVIENRYETQIAQHMHMEPTVAVGYADPMGDITIWTSHQAPYRLRHQISEALMIPPSRIKVITLYSGGGFGNKLITSVEPVCVLLSKKTRRPVRMALSREEILTTTTVRHPFVIKIKDGVMKDGRVVARDVTAILNGGAYSGSSGMAVGRMSVFAATNNYNIPNLKVTTYRVYTNQVPGGAFRGFGTAQMHWALESQMDEIAHKLSIDPIQLRLKNALKQGDENAIGEIVEEPTTESLTKVADLMRWNEEKPAPRGPWRMGRGLAYIEKYGSEPNSVAYVRALDDETVDVFSTVTEIGQGSHTALRQLAAEELGIPVGSVRMAALDTSVTPYDPGQFGSRSTYNAGNAILLACKDLKRKVLSFASPKLGIPPEQLEVRGMKVYAKGRDEPLLKVADLYEKSHSRFGAFLRSGGDLIGTATWYVDVGSLDPETGRCSKARANPFYTRGTTGVEVWVNTETGQTRIERMFTSIDAGRVINPALAWGQVEGCMSMGASLTLFEELVQSNGKIVNPDLKDYKIMTIFDSFPSEIHFIENPQSDGPFGARGVGEAAITAIAPAIANAIEDAVGVRVRSLPISAEKLLMRLKSVSK